MNKEKEPQKSHTVSHSKDANILEQHFLKTIIHPTLSNKLQRDVWLTSRLQDMKVIINLVSFSLNS